jgi:hypothetical protein
MPPPPCSKTAGWMSHQNGTAELILQPERSRVILLIIKEILPASPLKNCQVKDLNLPLQFTGIFQIKLKSAQTKYLVNP